MVKLNLRQNALHTLHHAVVHLHSADADKDALARSFDHASHMVEWTDEAGHLCFNASEFTRPPASYNLKFALLHLIQATELVLKSYIAEKDPMAIFTVPGSRKTIGLQQALHFIVKENPDLLSPEEVSLLLQAKDFRNDIEHYELQIQEERLRQICIDFLAVCSLLSERLLHVSIVDAFSWDYLADREDPVGNYIGDILGQVSARGRQSVQKAGELWASRNQSERLLLCLNCGARAVSVERGLCMGCGTEANETASTLIEELEFMCRQMAELKAKLGR